MFLQIDMERGQMIGALVDGAIVRSQNAREEMNVEME